MTTTTQTLPDDEKFKTEIGGIKAGMRVKIANGRIYELSGRWFTYPGMEPIIGGMPVKADGQIRIGARNGHANIRHLTRAEMVEIF